MDAAACGVSSGLGMKRTISRTTRRASTLDSLQISKEEEQREDLIERIASRDFQSRVLWSRVVFVIGASLAWLHLPFLDAALQRLYFSHLLTSPFFRHYSFEPLLASTIFAFNIGLFAVLDFFIPSLQKYRIQPYKTMAAWKNRLQDALKNEVPWYFFFWIPFGGLLRARRMATAAPTVALVIKEVLAGLCIYDALFYFGHNILHRVAPLYKGIHAKHHHSPVVRAGDSIRHSFLDGTWDVVCAVVALNVLKAHTLSRALFNLVAISLICEAHSGYHFPWAINNIVPMHIFAGSVVHDLHHRKGKVNFSKFFTWWDRMFGTYAFEAS